MEFVRQNKLALSIVAVLALLAVVAALVIGQKVVASFLPTLTPKSVNAEDYAFLAGKPKAKAPSEQAGTRVPTADVNPIALIELEGNVELSQVSVDIELGTGLVTLKLTDGAFEMYMDKVAELKSSETKFNYDSLQIIEAEVATLTDLPAVQSS